MYDLTNKLENFDRYVSKSIGILRQIPLKIWTDTIRNLDKYLNRIWEQTGIASPRQG